MLNDEEVKYVFREHGRLMTRLESAAHTHAIYQGKSLYENEAYREWGYQNGALSQDPAVIELLKGGFDAFLHKTANRIFTEHPKEVFFNRCPQCNELARTKMARQCKNGHTWHHLFVAEFKIDSITRITGRGIYAIGEVVSGNIKLSMRADLSVIGLTVRPMITGIEFALIDASRGIEKPALGFKDLPEFEQNFLRSNAPFFTPIPIML